VAHQHRRAHDCRHTKKKRVGSSRGNLPIRGGQKEKGKKGRLLRPCRFRAGPFPVTVTTLHPSCPISGSRKGKTPPGGRGERGGPIRGENVEKGRRSAGLMQNRPRGPLMGQLRVRPPEGWDTRGRGRATRKKVLAKPNNVKRQRRPVSG